MISIDSESEGTDVLSFFNVCWGFWPLWLKSQSGWHSIGAVSNVFWACNWTVPVQVVFMISSWKGRWHHMFATVAEKRCYARNGFIYKYWQAEKKTKQRRTYWFFWVIFSVRPFNKAFWGGSEGSLPRREWSWDCKIMHPWVACLSLTRMAWNVKLNGHPLHLVTLPEILRPKWKSRNLWQSLQART